MRTYFSVFNLISNFMRYTLVYIHNETRLVLYALYYICVLGSYLKMTSCSSAENQKWSHTKDGPIVNRKTGLCIDITSVAVQGMAKLEKCDSSKIGQKWKWLNYT